VYRGVAHLALTRNTGPNVARSRRS
jgi:hypothetical protein